MKKKELTIWQVIGIGILAGFVPILIPALSTLLESILENDLQNIFSTFFYVLQIWGIILWSTIPGGVLGAIHGKRKMISRRDVWNWAILGTILSGILGLFFLYFSGAFI